MPSLSPLSSLALIVCLLGFQCSKINVLFPILTIRFYAIGFIDGDPDFFFMFNCAMESENEFKAILCCHVVKPPNFPKVTFTSLKKSYWQFASDNIEL